MMAYRIQAGSLTAVARSPFEALRVRETLLADSNGDVVIAHIDGSAVDLERLRTFKTAFIRRPVAATESAT